MATEIVKNAVRYLCDAPACAFSALVASDDPPPDGYHGMVQAVSTFGASPKVPWFACEQEHIVAAIDGALAKVDQ